MTGAEHPRHGFPKVRPVPSPDAVVIAWERSDHGQDRGNTLLARTAAAALGVSPVDCAVSRLCTSCGSTEHGRPLVLGDPGGRPQLVSLARAGDLVVVAVSTGGPVGVDVERVDALGFSGFGKVAPFTSASARPLCGNGRLSGPARSRC